MGERGKKAVLQEADAKRGRRDAGTCGQAKKKQSPEYLARNEGQKEQKREQGIRCRTIFIWCH